MHPLLDNIIWHALVGPLSSYSVGSARARRFAPDFSPILGFADPSAPAFEDLVTHCQPGETFYAADWTGPVPPGWSIAEETTMFRMVWSPGSSIPSLPTGPAPTRLGPEHSSAALALALLTKPGPFGLRTIELGDYYGFFEHGDLIAMAGERFHAGDFREISGVCTHPAWQGRGLARHLMIVRQQ
ncbi:MAG: hypothetical protein J6386_02845 [Candidatus Synoicihabitans palmerolidicus]|nr:hypothetical protein [Candidatus Synoicihabitans palmerolidicus]